MGAHALIRLACVALAGGTGCSLIDAFSGDSPSDAPPATSELGCFDTGDCWRHAPVAVGSTPGGPQLHIQDFDGDGHQDLLATTIPIKIFFGDGGGQFLDQRVVTDESSNQAAVGTFDAGMGPAQIAILGPNRDVLLFDVESNRTVTPKGVVPSTQCSDLAAIRLTDDALTDLVCGDAFQIRLARSSTGYVFEPQAVSAMLPARPAVGDANGDGRDDVAFFDANSGKLFLFTGSASATLSLAFDLPVGSQCAYAPFGSTLVVAEACPTPPCGGFEAIQLYDGGGGMVDAIGIDDEFFAPAEMVIADLDEDGTPDVVMRTSARSPALPRDYSALAIRGAPASRLTADRMLLAPDLQPQGTGIAVGQLDSRLGPEIVLVDNMLEIHFSEQP